MANDTEFTTDHGHTNILFDHLSGRTIFKSWDRRHPTTVGRFCCNRRFVAKYDNNGALVWQQQLNLRTLEI